MYKGINRGVIASIHIQQILPEHVTFLSDCITQEHILAHMLGKVLGSNLQRMGFLGTWQELAISYGEKLSEVNK